MYFYPKDDTPGCTTEACSFRDALPQFESLNATVIGVSQDDLSSHKAFSSKYNLNFTLASDESGKVCNAYGCIVDKNMYGKTYKGIERSTFLIDGTGTLRGIWRKVSVEGHVDAVRESLGSLGSYNQAAA